MTVDPKTRMLVFGWVLAFAVALLLDQRVADGVAGHARDVKFSPIVRVIKLPGWYPFTLIVAAAVALFHPRRWTGAGLIAGSGALAGLFYAVLKWSVGRLRPIVRVSPFEIHPFAGGFDGLIHGHNLSFPSGHTCLAFATAATLAHLLPRARWSFYALACIVAAERVLEEAHYLSDVVAAAAIGIVAFRIVLALFARASRGSATPRLDEARAADESLVHASSN
jgi:membrane-associated phospholipid phosphatase